MSRDQGTGNRGRGGADTVGGMTKRGRLPVSAAEARVAHTRQKPKPRFVSKAHREELKGVDPLAFDDVRKVLARAAAPKRGAKS